MAAVIGQILGRHLVGAPAIPIQVLPARLHTYETIKAATSNGSLNEY